ncbi:indole-3-acetaldehyde oxidase-like [Zingiber officinale]|uniref:indole-3-acetaldehyde oxidase-like n=4 Tax=Zingiber officinale TaxID=94328 RepID=UPI001C4C9BC2|nr:indole-3-acetaldehyde oxidase-like [Zingiber officinale]
MESRFDEEDALRLVRTYEFPTNLEIILATPSDRPNNPPSDTVCFFWDQFLVGLRFPIHHFILEVFEIMWRAKATERLKLRAVEIEVATEKEVAARGLVPASSGVEGTQSAPEVSAARAPVHEAAGDATSSAPAGEETVDTIATACALTAFKLRHPIKMYLDRSTDMVMVGGRHPMKITYSVGFKSDGKITALYLNLLVNAGISEDYSPLISHAIITCLKKYNWGALAFDIKLCKMNLTSKSSMRAPGQVQGSYIAEAIIERVASFLSLDVDVVRKRNLHTYESLKFFYGSSSGEAPEYTLPAIVDELFTSASYFNRLEMVLHFNSCNKWKKRGISWVPIVYEVEPMPTPGKVSILNDGSIVVEVGGIEIGQGLWTKVKQMAAFGLEQLWDEEKKYLLDRVRIIQADTLSLVQGGLTAGSTKSEASCEAVRLACSILVSRLKPLKQSLEEQMGSISWDTLITQANLQYVNLSASTFWVADDTSSYLNYGAAISEVEIDVLTGATTILRADLTYDCGQSLSPAVDLGQVEGSFVQGIGFFVLLILFNI